MAETIVFTMDEFDLENLAALKKATGLSEQTLIHHSLFLTQMTMAYIRQGYVAAVRYDTSESIETQNLPTHQQCAALFNNRSDKAVKKTFSMNRNAAFLQALKDVSTSLQINDDGTAISYSIAYAKMSLDWLKAYSGIKSRICVHKGTNKSVLILTSPLNRTFANAFNRAIRRVKKSVASIGKKKKLQPPAI